ncbi:MAG: thiol-disulfide oxidoreductase DCC family protein [Bacteroidales bacterium]|nr:thiol-disulfide oxidoreductase DCC family protein [Bacteroidales bacterium]
MDHLPPILLFDGVCNLCNRLVVFVIRRDKNARIRFASLQSEAGKSLLSAAGLNPETVDTVVYLTGGKTFLRSSAILNLLNDLGGGLRLFYSLIIIPSFIRDFIYNLVARSRYRIFGKRESCMVPPKDIENRFIL